MKLLADIHISPRTVQFLRSQGYDVVRADELLSPKASDHDLVEAAFKNARVILTQDLDFSGIIALTSRAGPSLIT